MAHPREFSNNLPDYGIARSLGIVSADGFDFTKLANQLDCTRNFNQVGIIYSDGLRRWLVRPSRRQHSLQRELSNALVNISAFAGSALTGTIRNPQNIKQSGKYVIGLIQSFSFTE